MDGSDSDRVGDAGEVTATDRQGSEGEGRVRSPLSNAPPSLQPHFVFSFGPAFRAAERARGECCADAPIVSLHCVRADLPDSISAYSFTPPFTRAIAIAEIYGSSPRTRVPTKKINFHVSLCRVTNDVICGFVVFLCVDRPRNG